MYEAMLSRSAENKYNSISALRVFDFIFVQGMGFPHGVHQASLCRSPAAVCVGVGGAAYVEL